MPRKLRINRSQLAKFLPDHETIKEFEQLFQNESDLSILIENIIDGAGLEDDGTYTPNELAKYISEAITLKSADTLLDAAIWENTRELITAVNTSVTLDAKAQTVLCDAAIASFSVTMPNPSDCFDGDRSFRFAIHKIDTSSNTVTILPNGSESIVGETSQVLELDGEILNFITDGTNWYLGA